MQKNASCIPQEAASSVCLLTQRSRFFIVVKSCLRNFVHLVRVDPVNGQLSISNVQGQDGFPSEAAVIEHLRTDGPVEVLAKGRNVLGYVVIGSTALLLLADKLRVSCVLPGFHEVNTVVASKWLKLALQQPTEADMLNPLARDEAARGVDKLTTFPIDGAHYFCETLDLTRPFPSHEPVSKPSWEFVWNSWLSLAWRQLGLGFICPALLQGLLESRQLEDFESNRYNVALVSRRGRLHVGPRYKARGLNDLAEPGNEIECDQVIWRPDRNGVRTGTTMWSRYTWRRGSVPLWWGVSIKNNGIGEAEIKIRQEQTFKGSRRYVRRLQKRYCPNPHLDPEGADPPASTAPDLIATTSAQAATGSSAAPASGDATLNVPIVFVSLLRKGTPEKDRSETKLAMAFDFVVGALRRAHSLPLTYIALDWHEMDKVLGHDGITEAFWSSVRDMLPAHGFALGTMQKVGPDHTDIASMSGPYVPPEPAASTGRCISPAGQGWQARWFRQQRGLIRYNCADSLDRTNVSSFFGAIQVFVEQCRELDIAVALTRSGKMSRGHPTSISSQVAMGHGLVASSNWAFGRTSNGLPAASPAPNQQPGFGEAGVAPPRQSPACVNPNMASRAAAGPAASVAASRPSAVSALEKFGKELNNSINIIMQDLNKNPKSGGAPVPAAGSAMADSRDQSHATSMAFAQQQQQQQQQQQRWGQTASVPVPSTPVATPDPTSLPQGWEAKVDKGTQRIFYVDHNTKTTHWERPVPPQPPVSVPTDISASSSSAILSAGGLLSRQLLQGQENPSQPRMGMGSGSGGATAPPQQQVMSMISADRSHRSMIDVEEGGLIRGVRSEAERELWESLSPWCMLTAGVKKFGRRIHPDALYAMAELNLINGDMSAWLYTGSQAMHSERILIFEPETSKLRKAGVGSYGNMLVGIKRRYNNVLVDTDKQMQIEIFLGMKYMVYFCNCSLLYKEDRPIALDFPESDDEDDPVGRMEYSPGSMTVAAERANVSASLMTFSRGTPPTQSVIVQRAHNPSYNSSALLDEYRRSRTSPSLLAAQNQQLHAQTHYGQAPDSPSTALLEELGSRPNSLGSVLQSKLALQSDNGRGPHSETSSWASEALERVCDSTSDLLRYQESSDSLGGGVAAGSAAAAAGAGAVRVNSTSSNSSSSAAQNGESASAPIASKLHSSSMGMPMSASEGALDADGRAKAAASKGVAIGNAFKGAGTSVGSAFKSGFKKFADPLGLL